MDNLLIQKELLVKLKKNNIANFKPPSFVQAVNRGQISYTMNEKKTKKLYDYETVKKEIIAAGIGGIIKNKPTSSKDLDKLPNPEKGQSPKEYGEAVVAELGSKPTITDVNIYRILYQGKLEKLKYEKEKGIVINRDEVEDKAFSVTRALRDKLLSIPERLSNELGAISDPHEIKELLYKEFNKMLEGFSKDSFLWIKIKIP